MREKRDNAGSRLALFFPSLFFFFYGLSISFSTSKKPKKKTLSFHTAAAAGSS